MNLLAYRPLMQKMILMFRIHSLRSRVSQCSKGSTTTRHIPFTPSTVWVQVSLIASHLYKRRLMIPPRPETNRSCSPRLSTKKKEKVCKVFNKFTPWRLRVEASWLKNESCKITYLDRQILQGIQIKMCNFQIPLLIRCLSKRKRLQSRNSRINFYSKSTTKW